MEYVTGQGTEAPFLPTPPSSSEETIAHENTPSPSDGDERLKKHRSFLRSVLSLQGFQNTNKTLVRQDVKLQQITKDTILQCIDSIKQCICDAQGPVVSGNMAQHAVGYVADLCDAIGSQAFNDEVRLAAVGLLDSFVALLMDNETLGCVSGNTNCVFN